MFSFIMLGVRSAAMPGVDRSTKPAPGEDVASVKKVLALFSRLSAIFSCLSALQITCIVPYKRVVAFNNSCRE